MCATTGKGETPTWGDDWNVVLKLERASVVTTCGSDRDGNGGLDHLDDHIWSVGQIADEVGVRFESAYDVRNVIAC